MLIADNSNNFAPRKKHNEQILNNIIPGFASGWCFMQ